MINKIKNVLTILKSNGYIDKKNIFLNKNLKLKFDTNKKEEYVNIFDIGEYYENLPVLSLKYLSNRTLKKVDIKEIYDDVRKKTRFEIEPSLKYLQHLSYKSADYYSECKSYAVGEYCLRKVNTTTKLYKCIATVTGKTKFDESYWREVDTEPVTFVIETMDLPESYVKSELYSKNILIPYIYRSLIEHHNSILSTPRYSIGLNHYKTIRNFEEALYNLLGFRVYISTSESGNFYVLRSEK